MSDPITVTNLTQVGRINAPDPNQPRVFITYNADFSTSADITLDFTVVNQQQVFGIPRALFIDNGSNPNEVEVAISQTDMFFTVPAFAEGYFKLDAAQNSRINFVTTGGATDKVTITVYNYEIPPNVWYKFGPINTDKALKVQGTQPTGTDMDTADNNYPVLFAGVQADGTLTRVRVDSQGRLDFTSSINIGAVTIADGGDVTQGAIADAAVTNPTSSATVVSLLKGILSIILTYFGSNGYFSRPSTATKTSVAGATADTSILASKANRKGATIYNDSTAIMYISLGAAAASTTSFTTQIAAGGYYEVPSYYTGAIRAVWSTATGNARVTEIN